MASTAKRLAGPAQVSNAAATKYTAPTGTTAVIDQIHIQNPSASAVTFTMSIGADAAGTRLYDAYSIAANSVYSTFCKHVVATGEIVQALAGTNNILTLTLQGRELTAG